MGTHNTVNKVFHLVAFECMFTDRPFTLDSGLLGRSHGAFHIPARSACQHPLVSAVPTENVATVAACASVVEGVSRSRNALLNGDTRNYDWDSGYTCHQLGSGAIVIQLAQPFAISSLRYALTVFLLGSSCLSGRVEGALGSGCSLWSSPQLM